MNFALNPVKFEDVRTQIVTFLQNNSNFSGQFDFTASNIGLIIDTMAYVTMLMSYQISNTTNNLFLDTTTIRENALSIAKTMGYRPQRSIASKITGTIVYSDMSNNLTNHTIKIPAYTSFVSDAGYSYVNYNDIVLTSSDSHTLSAAVVLYEGTLKSYTYLGNGNTFQSFTIPSTKIEENHFQLSVRKNNMTEGTMWDEVKASFNLINLNSYFVEEDINNVGYPKIVFGDGTITNYPGNDEIVDIQYLETNADLANGSTLVSAVYTNLQFSNAFPFYNINNFISLASNLSVSYGGTPIESIDIIKQRAPKTFATVGRAVTQNDFNTILATYAYILKANSIGGDNLYPNDKTKLGNIYLTAIPIIQNMDSNFFNSNSIYLNISDELDILNTLNRYRIIGTYLSFIKPSYIYTEISPVIEIKQNASQIEVQSIKANVDTALATYAASLSDFAPTIRETKITSIMSSVSGVLSSSYTAQYSFALSKDSMYYPSSENNFLFLPILIKTKDEFGDVTEYTNFVRKNSQQEILLGITSPDVLPIANRTIYGKISSGNNIKYIYNEDIIVDGVVDTCDIKIDGRNNFFDLYRFEADSTDNIISNVKSFTFNGSSHTLSVAYNHIVSGGYKYDSYTLSIYDGISNKTFGTINRNSTRENGFKGLIDKESSITLIDSNTLPEVISGNFYKVMNNFPVTGVDKTFNYLYKDDVIIYNPAISKWIKSIDRGTVSAETDYDLLGNITHNAIYLIASGSGTFYDSANLVNRTPHVVGGDQIIYTTSTVSGYNWVKLTQGWTNFDATTRLPTEVKNYQLKHVVNLDYGVTTNFNGRTLNSESLIDQDLIYYNPVNEQWVRLGNTSPSGSLSTLSSLANANPVSGGSLESFDYRYLPVATILRVYNIGNFGTSSFRINWPSIDDVAYDGDILFYCGNGTWNIWQESQPDFFNVDGNVMSDLPIKVQYGDKLMVSVAGNFMSTSTSAFTYINGDYIVYTGNNTWTKYILSNPISGLNPSSSANLPSQANIGDMYTVTKSGQFSNSYLISPLNDAFTPGDVIIYNGRNYTKVNEYSFHYIDIDNETTSMDFINQVLNLNSVFHYDYDYTTRYYKMYFNDIFDRVTIGSFRYSGTPSGIISLYDVGKLTFETSITGSYDYNNVSTNKNIQDIFDDNVINKISFLPTNKLDSFGNVTSDPETSFETNFNTFIILNPDNSQVQ